jgi:general secretion pathway protein K
MDAATINRQKYSHRDTMTELTKKEKVRSAAAECRRPRTGGGGKRCERGVALLAVLWLAVALTFIGMATAQLVRTEIAATTNQIDWQRSYYLARGGIDAAVDSILLTSARRSANPEAPVQPFEFVPGKRWLQFSFPAGDCVVEVVPETAKLNINQIPPEQLALLFVSLGISPDAAEEAAAATIEWRSPPEADIRTALDMYYQSLPEPYVARHAPLEHIEEVLPVRGISPELFFGHADKSAAGEWRRSPALVDLLTTENALGAVNPNYAAFEVLRILPGWNDSMAVATVAARTTAPFRSVDDLQEAVPALSMDTGLAPLTFGSGPVYTLTATGFLPGSGVRRSIRALVRIGSNLPFYHQVLSWRDEWPMPSDIPIPEQRSASQEESRL